MLSPLVLLQHALPLQHILELQGWVLPVKRSVLCIVSIRVCSWKYTWYLRTQPKKLAFLQAVSSLREGVVNSLKQQPRTLLFLCADGAGFAVTTCAVLCCGLCLFRGFLYIQFLSTELHILPTFLVVQLLSPCSAALPRQPSLIKDMLTSCTSFCPLLWMLGEFQPGETGALPIALQFT